MSQNGKGDGYRPVDRKRYEENYEAIFGKEGNPPPDACTFCNGGGRVIGPPYNAWSPCPVCKGAGKANLH